jgi:hypothetical protein
VSSFEQACAESERSAISLGKAATALARTAKQLEKAAVEGDVQKIKRALDQVKMSNEATLQGVRNAEAAWSYSDADVEEMIRTGYEAELIQAGGTMGLTIRRQDEMLVAFPSLAQRCFADERCLPYGAYVGLRTPNSYDASRGYLQSP